MFFKNSRQTYALHLMNSLLNIFCYIISNASTRKNLHMVQLMTKSYPKRQEAMSRTHTRGMACFAQINLGQSSQDYKNLPKAKQSKAHTQSGAIKSRFRESL